MTIGIDIIERRLRRDNDLPETFHFSSWASFPPTGETIYYALAGGECPLVTRGKRKGRPNYGKITNIRTFHVRVEEAERWADEYEAETGKCRQCKGTGEQWAGWSDTEGRKMKSCERCGGTGRPAVT